jgi:class III poly(R)-hydroxyalkanoic acid synthase PhaE subunit
VNHTDSSTAPWLDAWLDSQHDWLQRWQAVPRDAGMGIDTEILRKYFSADGFTADATQAVQSFQALLQSGMTQFFGAASPAIFQQLAQAFAVGPAREHQQAWREFTQAMADYQARQQAVLQAYGQVFAQSLAAVRLKAEQQNANGKPVEGWREIYELWIECGEQAFAQTAHEESFIAAQAASANALSRWQLARNTLLEKWLKAHDLPTRSELNSVHLRLRELCARVIELEQRLNAKARTVPAKPRSRTRKPTSKV